MAADIQQKPDSPDVTKGGSPSATISYIVTGVADAGTVLAMLTATAPEYFCDLERKERKVKAKKDPVMTGCWDCEVSYGPEDPLGVDTDLKENDAENPKSERSNVPAIDTPSLSFSVSSQTQHITQGEHQNEYPDGTAKYGGAIGYDGKTVQGCDILVPTYQFTESHVFPATTVTQTYRNTIGAAVGKMNSDSFRGFEKYELLFMNVSGAERGSGRSKDWEISFTFGVSKKRVNVAVGDLTVALIDGWDYLWMRYKGEIKEGEYVKKPSSAHTERVYETVAFSTLGLGVRT